MTYKQIPDWRHGYTNTPKASDNRSQAKISTTGPQNNCPTPSADNVGHIGHVTLRSDRYEYLEQVKKLFDGKLITGCENEPAKPTKPHWTVAEAQKLIAKYPNPFELWEKAYAWVEKEASNGTDSDWLVSCVSVLEHEWEKFRAAAGKSLGAEIDEYMAEWK